MPKRIGTCLLLAASAGFAQAQETRQQLADFSLIVPESWIIESDKKNTLVAAPPRADSTPPFTYQMPFLQAGAQIYSDPDRDAAECALTNLVRRFSSLGAPTVSQSSNFASYSVTQAYWVTKDPVAGQVKSVFVWLHCGRSGSVTLSLADNRAVQQTAALMQKIVTSVQVAGFIDAAPQPR